MAPRPLPAAAVRRFVGDPRGAGPDVLLQLSRTAGNRAVARRIAAARNPGRLPESVAGPLEETLGTDLSGVRVHADSPSAVEVGALAYARGEEVHFAPGRYDPVSAAGRRLVGHEVAHVVQQREGRVAPTARLGGVAVNEDPRLEREADSLGERVAREAPTASWRGPSIARVLSENDGRMAQLSSHSHVIQGSFDEFAVPNVGEAIPPLYHGSDIAAVRSIMEGGFKVGNISAGRTYGDGVYATPYVSKAAQHAANMAFVYEGQGFAVGKVRPTHAIRPEDIIVHDMILEEELRSAGTEYTAAIELQHGEHFAQVAKNFATDESPIGYKEITAAARWLGKGVIIYNGGPGHMVYVFLKADAAKIENIVVEDATPTNVRGWEKLKWYRKAQFMDLEQSEINRMSNYDSNLEFGARSRPHELGESRALTVEGEHIPRRRGNVAGVVSRLTGWGRRLRRP